MLAKSSKKAKAKGSGAVDNWLEKLDLYRKNVAYDETCLFRAASEQIYDCQIYHEKVRKESIEYGRLHFDQFKFLVDIDDQEAWETHLNKLENHMVVCGNIEIHLISKTYGRDVLVFHANQQIIYDVTKQSSPTVPIMLCLMDDDHYDVVYRKEQIKTAGFCQSLVYKLLYGNVFKIPNVEDIVDQMLNSNNVTVISEQELEKQKEKGNDVKVEEINDVVVAPFPFKIAKALDPNIYRNIEYDSWGQARREIRLGAWYHGDDKLILGTKCMFKDSESDKSFECYIQDLSLDEGMCLVFLTELGERRKVKYSDLAPETNAQPWPLPVRFVKNNQGHTYQLAFLDKHKDSRRRNTDRKHSRSINDLSDVEKFDDNINAFIGTPLQMKNKKKNKNQHPQTEACETISPALPESQGPLTSDINNYPQRYQWEPVHWPTPVQYISAEPNYYPQSPEPFIWPQAPATPFFDYKPMLASAPATPNVVPYHDNSYPYLYNYQLEEYPLYFPLTPTTPSTSQQFTYNQTEWPEENYNNNLSNGMYCPCPLPCSLQNSPGTNVMFTPQTPQPLDMYSPLLNYPSVPDSPTIYTAPPPPQPDLVSNAHIYTPIIPTSPMIDQHLPPTQGFIYPSPSTPNGPGVDWEWYQHPRPNSSYNSQGFIFPQPDENNNDYEDYQEN
ncbi:unnamed protein product [Ceutorhynchus assimilis]|uniref:OTU domain-containing protein n=1 Tax=Ceutorhynchus assimilis TaxID=467358 RepID=A0A9P0GN02_9CUCU|nr:unnamed protein product [Ceutorhynchus assimilis]